MQEPESRTTNWLIMTPPRAEFHDIGKLIDWKAVGLHDAGGGEPHEFEACLTDSATMEQWGITLNGPAWEGIVRKEEFRDLRLGAWPGSLNWLLTSIADNLAAGYGRGLKEQQVTGTPDRQVHCLWRGLDTSQDPRLKDQADLREMINFLNTGPSWDDAVAKYGGLLKDRAEVARPGLNVTTLLRHSQAVGNIARVLMQCDLSTVSADTPWPNAIAAVKDTNKLHVVHYQIGHHQRPFRVKDLNIFAHIADAVRRLTTEFADNVLAAFDNQLILVFASPDDFKRWNQRIWDEGLFGTFRSNEKTIGELLSRGMMDFEKGRRWAFPELPKTLSLPICENCQMDRATHKWPLESDTDEPREDLCSRCLNIRQVATPLSKLSDEWRENSVAWVHVPLSVSDAIESLKYLQVKYLQSRAKNLPGDLESQIFVAFPLLADFVEAYKEFLQQFDTMLRDTLGADRVEERIGESLWCVSLQSKEEALALANDAHTLAKREFPAMLAAPTPFPIRFGISVSRAKHPFFAHWEQIMKPQQEMVINMVGSGRACMRLADVCKVSESVRAVPRRAAHQLATVARVSTALAELSLKEKKARSDDSAGDMDLSAIGRLVPSVIDFASARTLVAMMGGVDGQDY